jgi:hypothetical protein
VAAVGGCSLQGRLGAISPRGLHPGRAGLPVTVAKFGVGTRAVGASQVGKSARGLANSGIGTRAVGAMPGPVRSVGCPARALAWARALAA